MKLLVQYGFVFKMSDMAYKKLLRLILQGREWDIETLGGKMLGPIALKPLEITPLEARDLLRDLAKETPSP